MVFERVLAQALESDAVRRARTRTGSPLPHEHLRTEALRARAAIAAAAADEYRSYLEARATAAGRHAGEAPPAAAPAGAAGVGGLLPVMAVLVPVLSGAAALVFLLAGLAMRVLGGRPYIGEGLMTAGLIAAAVAGGAVVGDLAWLLVTAAGNRAAVDGGPPGGACESASDGSLSGVPKGASPKDEGRESREVGEAREAWQSTLLERGMVPFLVQRLEEAARAGRRDDHVAP